MSCHHLRAIGVICIVWRIISFRVDMKKYFLTGEVILESLCDGRWATSQSSLKDQKSPSRLLISRFFLIDKNETRTSMSSSSKLSFFVINLKAIYGVLVCYQDNAPSFFLSQILRLLPPQTLIFFLSINMIQQRARYLRST